MKRGRHTYAISLNGTPNIYTKYAPLIGSATAQQIINKNSEAWKSFLALRLEAKGRLPKHIKVSMPRYWKKNGGRELRILLLLQG